jgi:hypothetical protein
MSKKNGHVETSGAQLSPEDFLRVCDAPLSRDEALSEVTERDSSGWRTISPRDYIAADEVIERNRADVRSAAVAPDVMNEAQKKREIADAATREAKEIEARARATTEQFWAIQDAFVAAKNSLEKFDLEFSQMFTPEQKIAKIWERFDSDEDVRNCDWIAAQFSQLAGIQLARPALEVKRKLIADEVQRIGEELVAFAKANGIKPTKDCAPAVTLASLDIGAVFVRRGERYQVLDKDSQVPSTMRMVLRLRDNEQGTMARNANRMPSRTACKSGVGFTESTSGASWVASCSPSSASKSKFVKGSDIYRFV